MHYLRAPSLSALDVLCTGRCEESRPLARSLAVQEISLRPLVIILFGHNKPAHHDNQNGTDHSSEY